jgi:phospholipid/cholesterol/gamma-HCH transport system permease protein
MMRALADTGGIARLAWQGLSTRAEPDAWWRGLWQVTGNAALFVGLVMMFLGAIMSLLVCTQAQRAVGDLSIVGPALLQLLVRDFGPTVTGLLLAAQGGAALGAHVGRMRASEELDAMVLDGAHPLPTLVAPAIQSSVLGTACTAACGTAIGFLAGASVANVTHDVAWQTFAGLEVCRLGDLIVGIIKALVYGALIPAAACYYGLRAAPSARGVGDASTRAVIGGSIAVLLSNLVLSLVAAFLGV